MATKLKHSQRELDNFCKNIGENLSQVLDHLQRGFQSQKHKEKIDLVNQIHTRWRLQGANIQNTITDNLSVKLCKAPHGDLCWAQNEYFSSRQAEKESRFDLSDEKIHISTIQWANINDETFERNWLGVIDVIIAYMKYVPEATLTSFVESWHVYSEFLGEFWKYANGYAVLESGECAFMNAIQNNNGTLKIKANAQTMQKQQHDSTGDPLGNRTPAPPNLPNKRKRNHDYENVHVASNKPLKPEPLSQVSDDSGEKSPRAELLIHELEMERKKMDGLAAENGDLKIPDLNKLSRRMNRQMSANESDLENISIKARPMKILESFENFCSQEWLAAKTLLDEQIEEKTEEKEKCELLVQIIEECYMDAAAKYAFSKERLTQLIKDPFNHQGSSEMKYSDFEELDRDLEVAFSKELRINSDCIDMTNDSRELIERVVAGKSHLPHLLRTAEELVAYAAAALSLSWKMVLQQPAMTFDGKSLHKKLYNDELSELFYGSCDPKSPGALVDYYIHPALYHGDKMMKKAKVRLCVSTKPKLPALEKTSAK